MKKKERKYVEIGTFAVLGNQIRVTAPCYDKGVWCCGVLDSMRPGKYKAYVAYVDDPFRGHRVEMLRELLSVDLSIPEEILAEEPATPSDLAASPTDLKAAGSK